MLLLGSDEFATLVTAQSKPLGKTGMQSTKPAPFVAKVSDADEKFDELIAIAVTSLLGSPSAVVYFVHVSLSEA